MFLLSCAVVVWDDVDEIRVLHMVAAGARQNFVGLELNRSMLSVPCTESKQKNKFIFLNILA